MLHCTMAHLLAVNRVLDDDSVFIPINGYPCTVAGETAYLLLSNPGTIVLMPNPGSVFTFVGLDAHIVQVHIAVLPPWRGKIAVDALKSAFQWIFDNTAATKIIGMENIANRAAIRFIGLLGVEREGLLKNVDGKGMGMVVFGHCKPCA